MMVQYKVTVATGSFFLSGTNDSISITLVGERGQSPKKLLDNYGDDFAMSSVGEYHVEAEQDLGRILLVRLHKEPFSVFPEDSWYCNEVTVETPSGEFFRFPCYRWIEGYITVELREGKAKLIFEDDQPLLLKHREAELKRNQASFRWKAYPGAPWKLDVNTLDDLDSDNKFSLVKITALGLTREASTLELQLKGLLNLKESWKSFEEIERVFGKKKTEIPDYVVHHWKEDTFFGYEFLNGPNPMQIHKCTDIPPNFPVTDEMVKYSLGNHTSLHDELQKGNIFIADYEVLEGFPANVIRGQQQYIAGPMCLLYKTPADDIIPIAIQIGQTPGPENPIFLPSDSELDWTLAKLWVRNTDFLVQQAHVHYLGTHLFAEVILVSILHQLPSCHPVYKLLFPHFHTTFYSNMIAETKLVLRGGTFDECAAIGSDRFCECIKRGLQRLTYTVLCAPDNFASRGVDKLPKYYFRDDSLKMWSAIESFVSSIIDCYYQDDSSVQRDSELQAWVDEIFTRFFLSSESSGAPSALKTLAELVKYLTMIIYTCTAKHATVNNSQFDFFSWMPNGPATMKHPPPKAKGTATMENILKTLPEVDLTCRIVVLLWMQTRTVPDKIPLGHYPNQLFTEEKAEQCIKAFQERLSKISAEIQKRNQDLPLKYYYQDPPLVENSVAM
ncbi:hydroperoxide isomerase ALOXE3-like [Lissotriton helveticus]